MKRKIIPKFIYPYKEIVCFYKNKIRAVIIAIFFLACPFSLYSQQWVRVNSPTTDDILNIKFHTQNYGFILTKNKIFRTTDGCKSWDTIRTKANKEFLKFFPIDDQKMYVVSKSGELIKTMDGGNSWEDLGMIGEGRITEIFFLNDTVGYAAGFNRLSEILTGDSGDTVFFFRTINGGKTWLKHDIALAPVYALYFKKDSIGWAGGTIVGTSSSMLAYTSDGGKKWTEDEDKNLLWGEIKKIIFSNNDIGWAVGWDINYCAKSTDKGKTWHRFQISNLLGGTHYNRDIVSYGDEIIVCKLWGIFHSYDNGETFTRDSLNEQIEILSLSLNKTALAYAAGKTGAIWKYRKQQVGIHNTNDLPQSHYLFQNYPNPFNPSTKIKYVVNQKSNVKINLYDGLGRNISTLEDRTREPGIYEIDFEKDNIASGVYFYTLEIGNFLIAKKMIILN